MSQSNDQYLSQNNNQITKNQYFMPSLSFSFLQVFTVKTQKPVFYAYHLVSCKCLL